MKTLSTALFPALALLLSVQVASAEPADKPSSITTELSSPAEPELVDKAAGESPQDTSTESAARSAYLLGDRLYLEGDFQGAVSAFQEAYALSGKIEMLFNLANAHERLDNYEQASGALRGYIPHAPATQRPALERRLARFIELAQAADAREKNELNLIQAAKDSAVAEAEAARNRPLPVPSTKKQISWDRAAGIGLVILGGSALVVGTAFAISVADARMTLEQECSEGLAGRLCPASAQDALNRDKTLSIAADISFLAGAALSAGGLYLILHKSEDKVIKAGVGPQHLFVRGTF